MQRWATTLVGLAVVVLAVWLVVRNFRPPTPIGREPSHSAGVDLHERAQVQSAGLADAGGDDAAPLLLSDLVAVAGETERRFDSGVGTAMPDGTPVPPLPTGVPREVRFGVVLVSYTGAQPSVGGGRAATRTRADAKALAAKLLATAREDFHAAVQQGDAGSSDDVGRVKVGILEPAPEYLLFTVSKGEVAGPVDTPRGYWIVKRIE